MALINGASFTRMVLRYAPLERLPARFRKQVNSSKADAVNGVCQNTGALRDIVAAKGL
jgi:hypothetical protein